MLQICKFLTDSRLHIFERCDYAWYLKFLFFFEMRSLAPNVALLDQKFFDLVRQFSDSPKFGEGLCLCLLLRRHCEAAPPTRNRRGCRAYFSGLLLFALCG